ncbi:MAG: hypothetical protein J0L88_05750 [Xanthomonadales bacterium]|nr:hypothetical protein [Xanthomonadales bacterium]
MHPLATRNAACVLRARRVCRGLSALFVALFLASAPVTVAALEWRVELTPAGELFPALDLSQVPVGGDTDAGNGLLRIHLAGGARAEHLRVTVATDGLVAPATIDLELSGERVLRPRLDWDVSVLRRLVGARRQSLDVTVTRTDGRVLAERLDVRVHPLDEALYFVRDGDARIDLGWAFAAWVDPQDPVVDELVALAGIDARAAAADGVAAARAIWIALERRGLRYADDAAGISQGPVIYSQRVRLLADTWNERIANCLDGSVLIASALERLGVRTMLVLVPGHAFLGFSAGADAGHTEFLETTFLGRAGARDAAFDVRARAGFDAARRAGDARYRRAAPRLDGRHRPNYAIIDIPTARSYGIMPFAVGRRARSAAIHAPAAAPESAID